MTEAIPLNLDSLALKRLADAQERTADALEALLDLRRRELSGEVAPAYMKPKPAGVWGSARAEVLRLLDASPVPYLAWDAVKDDPALRDPGGANVYRANQWRRFLAHHAVPNKPDDGTGAVLVGIGREDRDGPEAVTRREWRHCAELARRSPENWRRLLVPAADRCAWCPTRERAR